MFPIRAVCTQTTWGTGGGDVVREQLCVMPTNMWNRKFYFFLHFWLLLLATVTVLHVLFRLATFLLPAARSHGLSGCLCH